jgi:glycerophosphoryl diester phosphodiesterase
MRLVWALSVLILVACPLRNAPAADSGRPVVIARGGASGYLPEHTLAAYSLAVDQGADFIAVDLVMVKDGDVFARPGHDLSETTDAAEVFPAHKKKKVIDGRTVEGWFSEDFTASEMRLLRARERHPFRYQRANGLHMIPNLAEILALRANLSREKGRTIGLYLGFTHPAYFRSVGLPLEEGVVSVLNAWALDREGAPVVLQSYEAATVKKLAEMTSARTILLLDVPGAHTTDAGLAEVATYAYGIGPAKTMIVPVNKQGHTETPTELVARAHHAGLKVYPHTFRPEPQFLPVDYSGDPSQEYCQFVRLGIDGLSTDTPYLALKAFLESCPMSAQPNR